MNVYLRCVIFIRSLAPFSICKVLLWYYTVNILCMCFYSSSQIWALLKMWTPVCAYSPNTVLQVCYSYCELHCILQVGRLKVGFNLTNCSSSVGPKGHILASYSCFMTNNNDPTCLAWAPLHHSFSVQFAVFPSIKCHDAGSKCAQMTSMQH